MTLRFVPQSPDSVKINQLTIPQIDSKRELLETPTNWHKFEICNVHKLKRNVVLKIIVEYVSPLDFIPLCYAEDGLGAYFFARICEPVIRQLCKDKLIIPNPLNLDRPFYLSIVLKYTDTDAVQLDLTDNLKTVLKNHYNSSTLCLDKFYEDPDLTEFFLLSQPKLLAFVLAIVAKNLKPKSISLKYNELKRLDAFKILERGLVSALDLRNNCLADEKELEHIKHLNITELWLEGNPLCNFYNEHNYVEQIRKYCPNIEKLDGFLLYCNGAPSFRRNFLCTGSAHNFIELFLENYFPTFESKCFSKLEVFYHPNAMFSMTANVNLQKKIPRKNSDNLTSYITYCRNFLNSNLYIGISSILNLFDKLPDWEHDPYSFTVDVVYDSNESLVLVVSGVLREVLTPQRIIAFNRHFIIHRRGDNFRILNEQLHIFNAFGFQQAKAFNKIDLLSKAHDAHQKAQMIKTFSAITTLKRPWAEIFLEECCYNFKHAMTLFVNLYEDNKIPSGNFLNLAN